ncbi:MAG TPA: VOC family protein [Candidatus Acidoferrales bacterium]|nr:VOC family protein [Candidatus Acidoferrales bacterium]
MGILELATPAVVICTRDRARSTAFYHNVLGLRLVCEDDLAAVFSVGGITLRISFLADFTPHQHTILGFSVSDVPATVKALCAKGLKFNMYPQFRQDELGILTLPGRTSRVAWFNDPDGNVLSVTNV